MGDRKQSTPKPDCIVTKEYNSRSSTPWSPFGGAAHGRGWASGERPLSEFRCGQEGAGATQICEKANNAFGSPENLPATCFLTIYVFTVENAGLGMVTRVVPRIK